jgi:hypothetical protein
MFIFLSSLFSDLQFAYYICSLQKTIDRYKSYTRENLSSKAIQQQNIQVKFYSIIFMTFQIKKRHELHLLLI